MNEPNGVIAGLLALSIAAGTKEVLNPATGQYECINNLDLSEARHMAIDSGEVLWPGAGGADVTLFDYEVPANQCLVVDYVSLYTCAADESSAAVDFGINWYATSFWQQVIGDTAFPIGQTVGSQTIFNRPVFMVFAEKSTPQIVVEKNASTQTNESRILCATMNAYQCPSNWLNLFKRYQTITVL